MKDTAAIRPDERFDEDRVARYLHAAVPELVGPDPITFEQFPGGSANLTYLARTGRGEFVLRRAPLGPVAKHGHDMHREYRVLSRLWKGYPPAPRAYHYCDDPDVMGKPFFVMERRIGLVIRSKWPAVVGDDPVLQRRIAGSVVDGLSDLHRVDAASIGLGDLGHPDGFVRRQVDGWRGRWEAAKTRDVPDMERTADILAGDIPDPQAATLLHNDYKLDNAMVSPDGSLVAVFDWDMTTRGDPLTDLGTLLGYWADPDDPAYAIRAAHVGPLTPVMTKEEVVDRYAAATGFDVGRLAFYKALALFRIAVILEQIYARYAAGQTKDARFAGFEPAAPILARSALDALG